MLILMTPVPPMTDASARPRRYDLPLFLLLTGLLLGACGRGETPSKIPEADGASRPPSETPDAARSRVVLTAAAAAAAGIEVAPARATEGSAGGSVIEAPGQVEADPSRTAFVSARAPGRLERLTAVIGDRVSANQVVAWVMSPVFVTGQQDFAQATRRASLLAGTADSAGGRALAEAARNRLKLLGLPDAELDRLQSGGPPMPLLPVATPFEGSIVEGLTLAGASVEAGTPIFRLIDLRELDVAADVPEAFLPDLRVGQRASITLAAYPDLRLTGRVERIKDELDPTTRTIEALVHVANPTRILRPGMFARVQLHVSGAPAAAAKGQPSSLIVPAQAIGTDGEERYVFVETEAFTYERRVVELSANDARFGGVQPTERVIHGDLVAGDKIVVKGAFTLKSELAKASFAEEE